MNRGEPGASARTSLGNLPYLRIQTRPKISNQYVAISTFFFIILCVYIYTRKQKKNPCKQVPFLPSPVPVPPPLPPVLPSFRARAKQKCGSPAGGGGPMSIHVMSPHVIMSSFCSFCLVFFLSFCSEVHLSSPPCSEVHHHVPSPCSISVFHVPCSIDIPRSHIFSTCHAAAAPF